MPNGFVGVGWGVTGTSAIVRSGPRKGAPRYDASDVFVFDGEELMPAVAGTPCAALGGTHCTRKQSYNRIVRNEAGAPPDSWSVSFKNGTKATFTPVFSVTKNNTTYAFRYGLTKVQDTVGNIVTYSYPCDMDGTTCLESYLETISYNGNEVRFYRESRPDPITYATGAGIAKTRYRLKSIAVRVNGQLARAYQLTYLPGGSATTHRSLLTDVQQFGRDASVNVATGTVTGSALPAFSVTTQPEHDFQFPTGTTSFTGGTWCYWADQNADHQFESAPGDFDGDGRTDLMCAEPSTGKVYIALSNGDGTFRGGPSSPAANFGANSSIYAGDFNGDDRADLLGLTTNNDGNLALSNGDGTFGAGLPVNLPGNWGIKNVGDYDGDGKTDVVAKSFSWITGGTCDACGCWKAHPTAWVAYSNGDGTFATQLLYDIIYPKGYAGDLGGYYTDTPAVVSGDFNGDGTDDLFLRDAGYCGNTYSGRVMVYRGEANRTLTSLPDLNWGTGDASAKIADLNNDGMGDLVSYDLLGGIQTKVSAGDETFATAITGACPSGQVVHPRSFGELNGVGGAEILCVSGATTAMSIGWLDDGSNTFSWVASTPLPPRNQFANKTLHTGDFDGDGKTDLLFTTSWDGSFWETRLSSRGADGTLRSPGGLLVKEIRNGVGGLTTVTYKSSTDPIPGVIDVPNPGLPFVVQTVSTVTTEDGRSHSNTLRYTFEGGKWSWSERRFLGFWKVKSVIDAQANFTETFYHQHVGCTSKPDATYVKDANGNIFSFTKYEYDDLVDASGVYTSRLIRRWDYECNLGTQCRAKQTELFYDGYANVTKTREWGGGTYDTVNGYVNVPGDERTIVRVYYPNNTPTAYIVALPGAEATHAGIGTATPPLRRERYRYDGLAYGVAPVKGLLTHKLLRKDKTTWVTVKAFTHDAFGNVKTEDGPKTGTVDSCA